MDKKALLAALALLAAPLAAGAAGQVVCAVPQFVGALEQMASARGDFAIHLAPSEDLEAEVANDNAEGCTLILSADQKLPIAFIRMMRADYRHLTPFASSPLIAWSRDPALLRGGQGGLSRLKSLAIADPRLTPVGYASHEALPRLGIGTLAEGHTFNAEQEFQVLSMVREGHVQVGLLSLPAMLAFTDPSERGSQWALPPDLYPQLPCYALPLKGEGEQGALELINYLKGTEGQAILRHSGFQPLGQ